MSERPVCPKWSFCWVRTVINPNIKCTEPFLELVELWIGKKFWLNISMHFFYAWVIIFVKSSVIHCAANYTQYKMWSQLKHILKRLLSKFLLDEMWQKCWIIVSLIYVHYFFLFDLMGCRHGEKKKFRWRRK